MLRSIRIVGFATLLASLFRVSQQIMTSRGETPVPGYTVAIGVVTLLFLVRAAATEFTGNRASDLQKDVLWGLGLGSFLSMLARLIA